MVSPQESCIVCENVQIFPKKALRKTEQFDETDSPNLLFAEPRCRPTCDRRKMLSFPKYCNKLYLVKPRLVECFQICKNELKLRLEKKISKNFHISGETVIRTESTTESQGHQLDVLVGAKIKCLTCHFKFEWKINISVPIKFTSRTGRIYMVSPFFVGWLFVSDRQKSVAKTLLNWLFTLCQGII